MFVTPETGGNLLQFSNQRSLALSTTLQLDWTRLQQQQNVLHILK